jgi:hypothetical protein
LENFGTGKTCTPATRILRTHLSNCGRHLFEQLWLGIRGIFHLWAYGIFGIMLRVCAPAGEFIIRWAYEVLGIWSM